MRAGGGVMALFGKGCLGCVGVLVLGEMKWVKGGGGLSVVLWGVWGVWELGASSA